MFQNNIPISNDILLDSAADIQGNFSSLGTVFNNVDTLACLFPALSTAPGTGANVIGLYNINNQLVFRQQSSGTSVPFTAGLVSRPGWGYLACGLKLWWGQVAAPNGGAQTVTFSSASGFPGFTQVFTAFGTTGFTSGSASGGSVTFAAAGSSPATMTFYVQNGVNLNANTFAAILVLGI